MISQPHTFTLSAIISPDGMLNAMDSKKCSWDYADWPLLVEYALHLMHIHLSRHLPGGAPFIEENVPGIQPAEEIRSIRSLSTRLPTWALLRLEAVSNNDPDNYDFKIVFRSRTALGIGTIFGKNQNVVQRNDGTTEVQAVPPAYVRHTYLTRLGNTPEAVHGVIEDDDSLKKGFGLEALPTCRLIAYCVKDARMKTLAQDAVQYGRLRDPLDKAKVLESVYLV